MVTDWLSDSTLARPDPIQESPAALSPSTTATIKPCKHTNTNRNLFHFVSRSLTHHVGVSSARHALTGVQVQELVDLRGSQTVSHLQFLDDKHLAGKRLFSEAWSFSIWSCSRGHHHWVRLMLETDLKREKEVIELETRLSESSNHWLQYIIPLSVVSPWAVYAADHFLQPTARSSGVVRAPLNERENYGLREQLSELCDTQTFQSIWFQR